MMYQIKPVSDLLFRSRVPRTWAEVQQLKDQKITTIINLMSSNLFLRECVYYKKEEKLLQEYGIKVIYIPLHLFKVPTLYQLEEIFGHLEQLQENTLIHCKHGVDRTGMAIAYWQIKSKAKSLDQAIKEMMDHGFHFKFFKWWIPYLEKYLSSWLSEDSESDTTNPP
jgi:protein-tyrosine phosphatase